MNLKETHANVQSVRKTYAIYAFLRKVVSQKNMIIKINSVKVTPTNIEETQTKRRQTQKKNAAQNVHMLL